MALQVTKPNFWQQFFLNNRLVSGSFIIIIYLAVISLFAYLLSYHIYRIYTDQDTFLTRYSQPVVRFIERSIGEGSRKQMNFREYFATLLIFNLAAAVVGITTIMLTAHFSSGQPVSLSLAVNTVISFLTNTNLQHYSDPTTFTRFTELFVIMGLMFLSAGTGFAASIAFIRGIRTDQGTLGNFYHDLLVSLFELLVPLTILVASILVLLGVPEATYSYITVHPVFSGQDLHIPIGPIATWEAIKNLGTNGGGFYGANAAFPYENPNWLTNITEVVSFTIIPLGSLMSLGKVLGNRKFGLTLYSVIMVIFAFGAFFTFFAEWSGVPTQTGLGLLFTGNMLGKETALGVSQSSIFSTGTVMTSTGAVNSALINMTPAGILGLLFALLMNDPLGGVGTGVLNIMSYVIFSVFISSLMIGRLPELMSIKIGSREIKYSSLAIITHPLMIMIPLGLTVISPVLMSTFLNAPTEQFTQLLYEFGTAASNNGSELGGFLTNQPFFNYIDSLIMGFSRYLLIGFQLFIAQSLARKSPKEQETRSIDVGSLPFGLILLVVMVLVGLLSFFPAFALGPFLTWARDFNLAIGGAMIAV